MANVTSQKQAILAAIAAPQNLVLLGGGCVESSGFPGDSAVNYADLFILHYAAKSVPYGQIGTFLNVLTLQQVRVEVPRNRNG
ncbi:hypothetical protein GHV40_10160 [Devosia sp. D6-9]|nr:hypothetical protein GHV40_10160 [Devosia sp. D6-9]